MQIDLFSKPDTTCVLAQLGSASLPVGNLQQIRLLLLSNTPAAGAAVPSPNACAGNGFNCVVVVNGGTSTIHGLVLGSQSGTGPTIPPGTSMAAAVERDRGQSV